MRKCEYCDNDAEATHICNISPETKEYLDKGMLDPLAEKALYECIHAKPKK